MTVRSSLLAHVQTWRPYTVWYAGLLGLAGAGLVHAGYDWPRLALAWATPTLGWIGGHYLGDYFDRELDAIGKPQRPIPSGRLAARTALVCGIAGLLAVAVLSVAGGLGTALVAVLAVTGIVAYGWVLKARGLSGNLTRGAIGGLTIVFGAAAMAPRSLASSVPLVLTFVVAVWAHDTSSNLVGTLRDMYGDRLGGYRTVPIRRGARVAGLTALRFYKLFVAAAVVGGILAPGGRLPYFVVLAAALVPGARAWLIVFGRRSRDRPAGALRAHELLVLERIAFAGAVITLGFGVLAAAVLVAPMLAATWWTQSRLRMGYELGALARRKPTAPAQT